VLWLALVLLGGKRGREAGILLLFSFLLSDQLSSRLLKNLIRSPRPFQIFPDVYLLVGKSSSFGFPSTHTSNIFALSTTLALYYPRSAFFLYPLALMVGFSRMYVGVHFPSDVIGGACLGSLCAWGVVRAYQHLKKSRK